MHFAPRGTRWEKSAAEKRLRRWAGAEKAPNDKLRGNYLWVDHDGSRFIDLKFPICDIVGSEPMVIFQAVGAAAGYVTKLSPKYDAIKPALERLYAKAAVQFGDPTIGPSWRRSRSTATSTRELRRILATPGHPRPPSETLTRARQQRQLIREARALARRSKR